MAEGRLVTTADREAAVARLSSAFAEDALSLQEFERRVEEVYRASSGSAIVRLLEDLDASSGRGRTTPEAGRAMAMKPRLAVAFGSVERADPVAVPSRVDLRAVFGNIELDLRDAEFGQGVTEISIQAVVGNVELKLPAHVSVENRGDTFFGSFAARVKGGRRQRDLPVSSFTRVVLTGRALFANVEVERES